MNIFFPNSLQSREEKPLYRGKKNFFIEYSFPSEKYLYLLDFWKERQPQGAALDQRFIKLKKRKKNFNIPLFLF